MAGGVRGSGSARGRGPAAGHHRWGKGLRAAVEQTWPQAAIQRCTVHTLRNLLTTAPKRLHDELRADYHAIVMAEDGAAARRAYTAFGRKWTKICAGAVRSLEEAGAELLTMYRYPRSQWKSLRSTNGLERLRGRASHDGDATRRWGPTLPSGTASEPCATASGSDSPTWPRSSASGA